MNKPNHTLGLRHVALFCKNFAACEHFYVEILGMQIDWRPDADNLYLTTGSDNFALHRAPEDLDTTKNQRLDHIGFFLQTVDDVDSWYDYLKQMNVEIAAPPKNHRDGSRSFYCKDPDGVTVQLIHMPSVLK